MKLSEKIAVFLFITVTLLGCNHTNNQNKEKDMNISENTVKRISQALIDSIGIQSQLRIERGVTQAASLWRVSNGNENEFEMFCRSQFVADSAALDVLYHKLEDNLEFIAGKMHQIDVKLKEPVQLTGNTVTNIDYIFAGYDVSAHLDEDLYKNHIGLIAALNFPFYSLAEKTELGSSWTRQEWAYARMGDRFTNRIPAEVLQEYARTLSDADSYISNYNIYMGHLLDDNNQNLFPEDMKLITHWGLRDELKSNYADSINGNKKQEIVYQVMQRIIDQTIPAEVINSGEYDWNPKENKVFSNGNEMPFSSEQDVRYQVLLDNFKVTKKIDNYSKNYPNALARNFDANMEIPQKDVEKLFKELLSSEQVKKVATLIRQRLGRSLRPYDIWYDGFKARGTISESELTKLTAQKYPNPQAFQAELPNILTKMGWQSAKAAKITSLVQVDPSTGAGHAWGAVMKGDKSRLRSRIRESGMDYKGYNIAIHEFGHNVEQTITLNDVDYWMLHGVPNNAFTEAVAFLFQKRDLELLGFENANPNADAMLALDNFWSSYEIMGVALLDIAVWEWLYEHPQATATQLKDAVIAEAKNIWNIYYADVLGGKDEPILAVYSHMIDYPLYLSYYPIGHLISFQVEQAMSGKNIADEMQRMYTQGRIVPQIWMQNAVQDNISVTPLLNAVDGALEQIGK